MKLDDLIKKNGGVRPPEHWECLYLVGGCEEVYETETTVCQFCHGRVWHVRVYSNDQVKLRPKSAEDWVEEYRISGQHIAELADYFQRAIEQEREACARVCDELTPEYIASLIGRRIRARKDQ